MTNSIPDSFSKDDLESMLDKAPADVTSKPAKADPAKPFNGYSKNELVAAVRDALDSLNVKFDEHVMIEKVIIMEALSALITHHTNVGKMYFRDEDEHAGTCWLRDAGKLQSAMTDVMDVEMKDDFMTRS